MAKKAKPAAKGKAAGMKIKKGDDVVLSNSRGPETLADLIAELGPKARAATASDAAAAADPRAEPFHLRRVR